MTDQHPYVAQHRGRFRLVWATDHDAPATTDRNVAPSRSYSAVERACDAAYGVTPQPYGIGF